MLPHYEDGFLGLLRAATGLLGRRVALPEAELSKIATPTLLIWGSNDSHGPVETGRRMVRVMPDARLEIRGVGHLPWLDDPDGCAELINDFLAQHPLTSSSVTAR
jgi:pimeloyl-ACP methyl ester carboxylesterase